MSLLKEFTNSRGNVQNDLKSSDGSDAGRNDVTTKPVDIGFSMMRNIINKGGGVTGSDVNNYLERARDLNDEVDAVGFAIETADGNYIKIYVNSQQADDFNNEMAKMLGLDDDAESAINTLAQKFDIVDVVWPQGEDGEEMAHQDPYGDVKIDDDPTAFMDDGSEAPEGDASTADADDTGEDDSELAADALPADDDTEGAADKAVADDAKPSKSSLMKDIGGSEKPKKDKGDDTEGDDEGKGGDDGTPPSDDDGGSDADLGDDAEPELDADGNPKEEKPKKKSLMKDVAGEKGDKASAGPDTIETGDEDLGDDTDKEEEPELDADGKPKVKKEKKKEVTEEGLEVKLGKLASLAESPRDDVLAHVKREQNAKRAKYVIDCLMTGGTLGRRQYQYKEDGEVKYFGSMEEAQQKAEELHCKRNHTMARAAYTFTPRLIEEQENDMTIGSQFLGRVLESADGVTDTIWKGVHSRLKRPYDKKIVELFSALGIRGTAANKYGDDLFNGIESGGDQIRRPGRKQTAFNAFYTAMVGAPAASAKTVEEAKKKGGRIQKMMESVLVRLGLPEGLVTASGPTTAVLTRAAAKIQANDDAEAALFALAKAFGISSGEMNGDVVAEAVDVGQDDFMESVMALVAAIGIPDEILAPRKAILSKALRAKKASLSNRAVIQQRMLALVALIQKGTRQDGQQAPSAEETDAMKEAVEAQISDKLAAKKIFNKIKGEPNLKTAAVKDLVKKYLPMVNKSEKDVAFLAAEVIDMLRSADLMESVSGYRLDEAFGALEALVGKDLETFNAEEPAAGPAMVASYEGGSNAHEDTVLVVAVDPDSDNEAKSLRVGIDGPWDGSIHAKYFANTKEGYKSAIDYANMLRTVNLKNGGRPKGWKDAPVQRLAANDVPPAEEI